jgi:ATP-dependent helicase/nuclease subunit A
MTALELPRAARPAAPGLRFTPDQRAAVEDRSGSGLLAANAGSGKTAVMVERFVEAVRQDGVAVGSVLALTFTEKAASELRERVRRRFTALGDDEHAREAEAAWIGTIHGFCARVLRARPLAAGLDPRFVVLDEAAARRLADQAYDEALEAWAAARGSAAVDLAAAYGQWMRDLIIGAHDSLRSRGEGHPRLPVPAARPAPDPAELAAARAAAAAALGAVGEGKKVAAAREALEACDRILGRAAAVPWPGTLDPAKLGAGAKALDDDACAAYRAAWDAYRTACADHHARAALELLDDLLDRFGTAYAAAKTARAGVDFSDLELRVRDLLRDPAARRSWAERFALIMVDEFQDTNRLQLDVLEALERENLFAVGDEFQSIYGFRHADVTIFRERRERLGAARVRRLAHNFRSGEELLDVLNGAFAPTFGDRFAPLIAGGERPVADDVPLRLFDPDPGAHGEPPVELLVTDTRAWDDPELERRLGLAALSDQPARRAEARLAAQRLRAEVDAGRRPGDVVVLVRATASLRLFEQALEEQGLPTYVVGGRGYWSQEQVRDGLAYLAALANPRDEEALLGALASPFCGAGTDALVLVAQAGREPAADGASDRDGAHGGAQPGREPAADGARDRDGAHGGAQPGREPAADGARDRDGAQRDRRGAWAALQSAEGSAWLAALPGDEQARLLAFARFFAGERARAERLAPEVLLERAIVATGYDLAILARSGGERRLANLRKLMRLARDYGRAEGPDLRGFLAFAATQDLVQAREGEAALESDGLDAVRLMTIHRAKGLEFPVVCVADLGRAAGGARDRLLLGRDGSAGLRLAPIGGGETVPALDWERLARAEQEAEAEEERRLFYVAMTRARERLILSGCLDLERRPEPRPGGPPIDWIARALVGDGAGADAVVERRWDGRPARVRCRLNDPAQLAALLPTAGRARAGAPGTALADAPAVLPAQPSRPRPAPQRLSYSSLGAYARCGYRFYLERVLRLPPVAPPPDIAAAAALPSPAAPPDGLAAAPPDGLAAAEPPGALSPIVRGSLVHRLLEDLDYARPVAPAAATVRKLAADMGAEPTEADVEDVRALVAAFAASPLCARLAAARRTRREAPFAFGLDAAGGGPLVTGFLDVVAVEPDGGVLIVDFKSDRLDDVSPAELTERDYATQRIVYALAALRDGAPRAEVAHCFLERPGEPVTQAFTAADASALAERLAGLAAGVLEGRYPVTDTPHRELCGDCPGRAALCSWPEEKTLGHGPS